MNENETPESGSNDMELKESLLPSSDIIPTILNHESRRNDENFLGVKSPIEEEALRFNFNRRRATSCVEISPRVVPNLRKEEMSQEKADSLDNFLNKVTSKNHINFPVFDANKKQLSMNSLQSLAKLTVNSKIQSTTDLKPKKTEKFAQVWNEKDI